MLTLSSRAKLTYGDGGDVQPAGVVFGGGAVAVEAEPGANPEFGLCDEGLGDGDPGRTVEAVAETAKGIRYAAVVAGD